MNNASAAAAQNGAAPVSNAFPTGDTNGVSAQMPVQPQQPIMNSHTVNPEQFYQMYSGAVGGYPPQYGAYAPNVQQMGPPFQTPLSPAFKTANAGPPAGTVPGTPGPQGAQPNPFNTVPSMPQPLPPNTNIAMPPVMGTMPPNQMTPMTHMGMTPMGMGWMMPPGIPHMPQPGTAEQPSLATHNSIVPGTTQYSHHGMSTPGMRPRDRIMHQEIKLEIICKNLRDRDLTSKSDPVCVVFLESRSFSAYGAYAGFYPSSAGAEFATGNNGAVAQTTDSHIQWKEVSRTECIKNCLNPHFKVQITVPYHFEELQHIRLGLWDIDSKKQDLSTHDFLGDVRTTVAELVMAGVWTSPLSSNQLKDQKTAFGNKRNFGNITVIVHEGRDGGNMLIKAAMCGKKLDRKDFWFTSDPYFIVSQLGKTAASRSQLYKSEVVRRTVNPTWRPFQFKVAIPKGGGKEDIKLEILVYDKDNHKRDDEIGKAVHSLSELESQRAVPVINEPRKTKRRSYKNSGMLEFTKFEIIPMPTLVDYIQGGLKLHFSVAVDLTASNGDPKDPTSLHFLNMDGNRYTRAIIAIANVLQRYQSDSTNPKFAAFGFGAELPRNPGYTSSCFPLSLESDPMVTGISGIMEAYNRVLHSVRFSGPTNFAPLIETVSRTAAQRINTQTDQNYDVLLILTDGVVSDFDLTVDRIIAASKTPLSVIIVGIGNRNFRKMKELDSDDILLTSSDGNRQAQRDICQFVDFAEYERSPPERLGAAVLAEMPGNIVEYFVGNCDPPIHPGQRPKHLEVQ